MQIREGAYYRTRGGDVVGPMYRNDLDAVYPWSVVSDSWTDDGRFNVHAKESVGDLISEVYVSDTPPDAPLPDIITDQPCKTLRDEFAGYALPVAYDYIKDDCRALSSLNLHVITDTAYVFADAMMESRKK